MDVIEYRLREVEASEYFGCERGNEGCQDVINYSGNTSNYESEGSLERSVISKIDSRMMRYSVNSIRSQKTIVVKPRICNKEASA